MNIENYIESQYRELIEISNINMEFSELYTPIKNRKLTELLSTLHHDLISSFRTMNERLPTNDSGAHFWAEPSRQLIKTIDIILALYNGLKKSELAFQIDDYYFDLISKSREFLCTSGGSSLPPNMEKINLYYKLPIFMPETSITLNNPETNFSTSLKLIGSGSYANVYKYKDNFYNKHFVLKRAKKDLNEKEIIRFKREFEVMNKLSSPYIPEVYRYDESKNEYIMEYMDFTLDSYISKKNNTLLLIERKKIAFQILKAFEYIHSQNNLHRDISPKNILIKNYEDVNVVKIADFGLAKIKDSSLTSLNTEFKGYFNDPALVVEGFDNYSILHETYALTRIIYYVVTGKITISNIADKNIESFVVKGLNADKSQRFQNINEMITEFKKI
jgi:serine/threonine-protein kinase